MANPLKGRLTAAHVGCCVFCVVVFVMDRTFSTGLVESPYQQK